MAHSNHGIVRNKAEEQPADKERAEAKHQSDSPRAVSREATRDPKLSNSSKTPGSGTMPDDSGDAPTG